MKQLEASMMMPKVVVEMAKSMDVQRMEGWIEDENRDEDDEDEDDKTKLDLFLDLDE